MIVPGGQRVLRTRTEEGAVRVGATRIGHGQPGESRGIPDHLSVQTQHDLLVKSVRQHLKPREELRVDR